jgi:hypothetical protein
MIKEHEDITEYISTILTDILTEYGGTVKHTVKYVDFDTGYQIVEVYILNGQITDRQQGLFIDEIEKSHIVSDIYTLEDGKLYSILLKPLNEIRSFKINMLQKKMEYETNNKV